MNEYIEREAAVSAVHGQRGPCRSPAQNRMLDCLKASIIRISAADVAPAVHGRWDEVDWVEMESGGHELIRTPNAALRCSNCRNCFKKELLWKNNYCPNCGAKMDGGADHEAD